MLGFIALLVVTAVIVARAVAVYPELPATIASHFDSAGVADGWSSKEGFCLLMGGILAMVIATGALLPLLAGRAPVSWFNMPDRDYWLAPERSASTRRVMQAHLVWFSVGTLALLGWVTELTWRANLAPLEAGEAPTLPGNTWAAIGVYFVFVGVWLVGFMRRFKRPATG